MRGGDVEILIGRSRGSRHRASRHDRARSPRSRSERPTRVVDDHLGVHGEGSAPGDLRLAPGGHTSAMRLRPRSSARCLSDALGAAVLVLVLIELSSRWMVCSAMPSRVVEICASTMLELAPVHAPATSASRRGWFGASRVTSVTPRNESVAIWVTTSLSCGLGLEDEPGVLRDDVERS